MIIMSIVMILYLSGSPLEYTYHEGISSCLKQKREIERLGWKDRKDTRYSCEKRKIELESGTKNVLRLVD